MQRTLNTRLRTLVMSSVLGFGALFAQSATAASDGIIAMVNDEVILQSELSEAANLIAKQLATNGVQLNEKELQLAAMDSLIVQKLQLGLIKRAGLQANEAAINQQLLGIAKSQGLDSLAALQAKLDGEKAGSYAALRKQVIEQAALAAMWQSQVGNRVHISDAEVEVFLNSPQAASIPELASSQRILVPEWQTSHILARIDDTQNEAIAEQKINALYERVQQGVDFATLAATYSDDAGSAANYGALGWVTEGQMVPEFEAMMKQTDAGDYSVPFRSQFGWHILKVDQKRDRDVTDQVRRNIAREYLFARQAPQAEEDWLQELRSSAYIKIF